MTTKDVSLGILFFGTLIALGVVTIGLSDFAIGVERHDVVMYSDDVGYLRPGDESSRIQDSLRIAVDSAPLLRPAQWRETTSLPETSWRDEWKKYFALQRIGRSLIIRPSWIDYDRKDGDVVIDIDPECLVVPSR